MKISDLDITKTYTYADYLKWTFDETVVLIKGRLFRMAAPLSNHQKVSGNLFFAFQGYLKGKPCNVYAAPFDVRLPKPLSHRRTDADIETVVQPDISIVCDLKKIDRRGCVGYLSGNIPPACVTFVNYCCYTGFLNRRCDKNRPKVGGTLPIILFTA